jgi:hypothetical protein
MNILTPITIISFALLLAACVGVIVLQVFLCKRPGKFLGLILPAITFIFSLQVPLAYPVTAVTDVGGVEMAGMGIAGMLWAWLLANIPTLVLLAIYAGFKTKQKQASDLDKMAKLDLR